jgi:branched-chain amino acid aminotransferase
VIERAIDKSELFIADEVFLSGTAAKITPVKQIETYSFSSDRPITNQLREKLIAITENREPRYRSWITTVTLG